MLSLLLVGGGGNGRGGAELQRLLLVYPWLLLFWLRRRFLSRSWSSSRQRAFRPILWLLRRRTSRL